MTDNGSKTFVKITNRQMYEKINEGFEKTHKDLSATNDKLDAHIKQCNVQETKIKTVISWHQKLLMVGGTLIISMIGWIIMLAKSGVKP